MPRTPHFVDVVLILATSLSAQRLAELPVERDRSETPDWLIDARPYSADVFRSANGKELVLSNGLVRRAFRLAPDAATVALDDLTTGRSVLRAAKPEAIVELDGKRFPVGGLRGQPNHAFLRPEWLDRMQPNKGGFHLVGFTLGKTAQKGYKDSQWAQFWINARFYRWCRGQGIYLSRSSR